MSVLWRVGKLEFRSAERLAASKVWSLVAHLAALMAGLLAMKLAV